MSEPKFLFGGQDVEFRQGSYARLIQRGTRIRVYRDAAKTNEVTLLVNAVGVPIDQLKVTSTSTVPYFGTVADDTSRLFLSVLGGPMIQVEAVSKFVIAEKGVTDLENVVNGTLLIEYVKPATTNESEN